MPAGKGTSTCVSSSMSACPHPPRSLSRLCRPATPPRFPERQARGSAPGARPARVGPARTIGFAGRPPVHSPPQHVEVSLCPRIHAGVHATVPGLPRQASELIGHSASFFPLYSLTNGSPFQFSLLFGAERCARRIRGVRGKKATGLVPFVRAASYTYRAHSDGVPSPFPDKKMRTECKILCVSDTTLELVCV